MRHSGENPVLVLRLPALPQREAQLLRGREGGVKKEKGLSEARMGGKQSKTKRNYPKLPDRETKEQWEEEWETFIS